MDFSGHDAPATAQLTGDEDRIAGAQLPAMSLDNAVRDFDLAAARLQSLLRIPRVGSRKGDQQQRDRTAVATFVLQGFSGEDSAEKQAVQYER